MVGYGLPILLSTRIQICGQHCDKLRCEASYAAIKQLAPQTLQLPAAPWFSSSMHAILSSNLKNLAQSFVRRTGSNRNIFRICRNFAGILLDHSLLLIEAILSSGLSILQLRFPYDSVSTEDKLDISRLLRLRNI
jgi:hypothetical protein